MKKVISVEYHFPGDTVEFVPYDSNRSLLEADIIIFKPDIHVFIGFGYETYQGKPALSETNSFSLIERTNHWKRELKAAYEAGKLIIVIMGKAERMFVDSGEKSYSGTGRSRVTTRRVTEFNNYQAFPLGIKVINTSGKSMQLTKHADSIREYWKSYGEHSEYEVYIEGTITEPFIQVTSSERIVGALIRHEESGGIYLLLPDLKIHAHKYVAFDEDEEAEVWTDEGMKIGHLLKQSIIEIADKLMVGGEKTAEPDWAKTREYLLEGEKVISDQLIEFEGKIEELQQTKQNLKDELREAGQLRDLIFEKGKILERAIVKALTILGFEAEPYKDSDSEFDVVFVSKEGRLIGEAEGKDRRQINIDKMRQLETNLYEDLDREEVKEMAKGVLFGNAFRLQPPDEREDIFSEKCVTAAKRNGVSLVKTTDLFHVAKFLSENRNARFATQCRKAIINSVGTIVEFPEVPKNGKTKESLKK